LYVRVAGKKLSFRFPLPMIKNYCVLSVSTIEIYKEAIDE